MSTFPLDRKNSYREYGRNHASDLPPDYRPCISSGGVLSMQNMKYSKDYTAWMANAESLDALLEAKSHLSEIVPSGFSSDEDDDEDEEPAEETEASPEEVLQYAWETVCYVIWGKASAKGGQKVVEAASEELKERYSEIFSIECQENSDE